MVHILYVSLVTCIIWVPLLVSLDTTEMTSREAHLMSWFLVSQTCWRLLRGHGKNEIHWVRSIFVQFRFRMFCKKYTWYIFFQLFLAQSTEWDLSVDRALKLQRVTNNSVYRRKTNNWNGQWLRFAVIYQVSWLAFWVGGNFPFRGNSFLKRTKL